MDEGTAELLQAIRDALAATPGREAGAVRAACLVGMVNDGHTGAIWLRSYLSVGTGAKSAGEVGAPVPAQLGA